MLIYMQACKDRNEGHLCEWEGAIRLPQSHAFPLTNSSLSPNPLSPQELYPRSGSGRASKSA